jgi:xanthine dehydrogenase large subunit
MVGQSSEPTIGRSKAVGEPPFMLAMSVVEALSHGGGERGGLQIAPQLDTPVTPERVLMGVERMKREARG